MSAICAPMMRQGKFIVGFGRTAFSRLRESCIFTDMTHDLSLSAAHPVGGQSAVEHAEMPAGIGIDSFTGPVRVEWDRDAALTALGHLSFFIDFLKTAGLFEAFVADCPLRYTSPNAPKARDVLGTAMLSILSGHTRYAHIAALRGDAVVPELLGMKRIVSEDAVRRAFVAIEEEAGAAWLRLHPDDCTAPLLAEPWILDMDTTVKSTAVKKGRSWVTTLRSLADRAIVITPIRWPARGSSSMSMCAPAMSTHPSIRRPACGRCWIERRAIAGPRCCAATPASAMSRSCAKPNSAAWLICSSCD